MTCQCVNINHQNYCGKPATKKCTRCGDFLCGGCAKNHHAHQTFEKVGGRSEARI